VSATVASLATRADGGQFQVLVTPGTNLRSGGEPLQKTHPLQRFVPHDSEARTAIAWSAVYRTRRLPGDVLVVDTVVAAQYLQLVLDHVETLFDALDLDMNLVGVPANGVLGPTGQPNPGSGKPGS